jgi:hypothetical protein
MNPRRSNPTQLSRQSESDRAQSTMQSTIETPGLTRPESVNKPDALGRVRCREREQGMSDPAFVDAIGFAAAGLVLATFSMRSMIALRWVAIASNLAFIAYGYLGHLPPILLLHVLLLPINACRLAQLRQQRTGTAEPGHIPCTQASASRSRHLRSCGRDGQPAPRAIALIRRS